MEVVRLVAEKRDFMCIARGCFKGVYTQSDVYRVIIASRTANRSSPNLETPYLRSWCITTFSPIFLKPLLLAITGM